MHLQLLLCCKEEKYRFEQHEGHLRMTEFSLVI